ncbi:hypothetical protein HanIR_Chr14g0708411 [Helianthus annuus]|nr:hypothetical protein HanIR_Chr14g0708411 [Helianthus annuus]
MTARVTYGFRQSSGQSWSIWPNSQHRSNSQMSSQNWSTARVNGHICSVQFRCSGDLGVPFSLTHTLVNTWIIGRLSNSVEDDDVLKIEVEMMLRYTHRHRKLYFVVSVCTFCCILVLNVSYIKLLYLILILVIDL